ncbi:MAG: DUF4162 domain-containing protein, partial [Planctomycetaceae bacterium]|nr:DUF4162 domain-containing protein [Planctomycetaceae bacterium]
MSKTVLISSHILTELGEICDSVSIIEAGKILASGTIEELQQGTGSSVEVDVESAPVTEIEVTMLGDAGGLETWLVQQAYVDQVTVAGQRLTITFTGDDDARHGLLKAIVLADFRVVSFETKTQSLEDTFMRITRGELQ